MRTEPAAYPDIASFIDQMRSDQGATAVDAEGGFLVAQRQYRLSWVASGPQVQCTHATPEPFSSMLRRRLGEGTLASWSSRMTRALAEDRTARHRCLEIALSIWRDTGAGSRTEAVQRIRDCHASSAAELDLRGLGLSTLPMALAELSQLRVLRLGGNRLDALPSSIEALPALEVLELEQNLLGELPPWFHRLKHLRVLSLSGNRLTAFPEAVFSLPRLATLWIDDNRIEELPFCSACHFECFAWRNPLSAEAIGMLSYVWTHGAEAPVYHDSMVGANRSLWQRSLMPPPGPRMHGCLVPLLHASGAQSGGTVLNTTLNTTLDIHAGLAPAEAKAGSLMRDIRSLLCDVPVAQARAANILQYRLDLLQRWMATDVELCDRCVRAVPGIRYMGEEAVLEALDDIEAMVVEHLLERFDFDIERLAGTGRSLYRRQLLQAAIEEGVGGEPAVKAGPVVCRMLLAHALDLPGQTRPILESAAVLSEHNLDRLRESVLSREAQFGFDGLDVHMADWRPWQQYVRRMQDRVASGTAVPESILPPHVATAIARLPGVIASENARMPAPMGPDQSFRMLCRVLHRIWREGTKPASRPAVAMPPTAHDA
ncbi:leucine-rich repeat domain-containing protein [Paracidovorax citrulli]